MSSMTPKLPSTEGSKSTNIGTRERDSVGDDASGGVRISNGSSSGGSNGLPSSTEAAASNDNKTQPTLKQPQQPQQPLGSQPSAVLESKLRTLQSKSNELSQALTQRLAASESGQNLLHIGSSLSTLPPDLQSLLASLRPLLKDTESFEAAVRDDLARVVKAGTEIRVTQRRVDDAMDCSDMYRDLLSAERDVRRDAEFRGVSSPLRGRDKDDDGDDADEDDGDDEFAELDHVASLERAAHTTLHLTQQLKISTAEISAMTTPRGSASHDATAGGAQSSASPLPSLRAPLPDDTERAQFLMKLAPRIRRLEDDTVKSLVSRLEAVLTQIKNRRSAAVDSDDPDLDVEGDAEKQTSHNAASTRPISSKEEGFADTSDGEELENDLLKIGHCIRGLALLGRGSEAESAFARVAIMPLIRSRLSMGRLDQGGSRGECAGLFSFLNDLSAAISDAYGPVLQMSEGIFGIYTIGGTTDTAGQKVSVEVDLLTAGVWIPIATALLADPAIKMAIFSPGIASILQANYTAIDNFLSNLGERMLRPADAGSENVGNGIDAETVEKKMGGMEQLYFRPSMSDSMIRCAQARIHQHEKTAEFMKKWNLPIYYQLRFGECCARLDTALNRVQIEGWSAAVFTGSTSDAERLRNSPGLELPFFMELYDTLSWLWSSDVYLQPLTHRFVRGAVQLLGRSISFVRDGLEGKISFGKKESPHVTGEDGTKVLSPPGEGTYCWGDRVEDVAAVAWELTVLEMAISEDYVNDVVSAASSGRLSSMGPDLEGLRSIIASTLTEVSRELAPIIAKSWNEIIVNVLTKRCCAPLSAVKGVAATYRMTNRPPPTQPSPFVSTVLRSLKEFDSHFSSRTPPQIGFGWKREIVSAVAEVYSGAVEELLATVQRTEVALKNRKARRGAAGAGGGMSDGEKVKLQLYLDQVEFARHVQEVGLTGAEIPGLVQLVELTSEAQNLQPPNGTNR